MNNEIHNGTGNRTADFEYNGDDDNNLIKMNEQIMMMIMIDDDAI